MKFEGISAHTKTCWSRIKTGSPKDQEADLLEFGPEEEPTDDQIIHENQDRIIYNPDTKTIDWRKQKATDLRDCPKLRLPPARPTAEEIQMSTKERFPKLTDSTRRSKLERSSQGT